MKDKNLSFSIRNYIDSNVTALGVVAFFDEIGFMIEVLFFLLGCDYFE